MKRLLDVNYLKECQRPKIQSKDITQEKVTEELEDEFPPDFLDEEEEKIEIDNPFSVMTNHLKKLFEENEKAVIMAFSEMTDMILSKSNHLCAKINKCHEILDEIDSQSHI